MITCHGVRFVRNSGDVLYCGTLSFTSVFAEEVEGIQTDDFFAIKTKKLISEPLPNEVLILFCTWPKDGGVFSELQPADGRNIPSLNCQLKFSSKSKKQSNTTYRLI